MSAKLDPEEKKRVYLSLVFPALFLVLIWIIYGIGIYLQTDLSFLGIFPLNVKSLPGILTSPFIHADIRHLVNNSVPVFVLSWGLFYFYNKIAYKVFFLIYFMTGLWVWFGARHAYHIGASGIIYGLGAFIFFSGIIRKNINLLAISLLVTFLYGSMVWGIFPYKQEISWESHLLGGIAGFILAIYFRNEGPASTIDKWKQQEPEEDEEENYHPDDSAPKDNPPVEEKKRRKGFFRDPFDPEPDMPDEP
ncbi:MAG: rhomboid family intramembrane serine protease [Bacteroidales bacterium]|nr:rhomboid family intramembrane serine protease [Bacteroidales bacterium]